jgi:hypothetical protein
LTHPVPQSNACDHVFDAFFQSCNGGLIRNGSTRDAYAITCHPDKVIKVGTKPAYVTNWVEIVTYLKVRNKIYFAEIFSWSQSGKYLVMERLTPLSSRAELNGWKLPEFVNDYLKTENFGKTATGTIKCLDYGMIDLEDIPLRTLL